MKLALFLAPPVALALLAVRPQAPEVRWRSDWEAARKEAKEARKPLFVVFRCER